MLIKPPHGTVVGSVIGSQPSSRLMLRPENTQITSNQSAKITPKTRPREVDMPRAVNYYADFSGCGFWRMLWPEHTLNAYQKVIVHGSTVMVTDEKFYTNVKCVRIQRQATPQQAK